MGTVEQGWRNQVSICLVLIFMSSQRMETFPPQRYFDLFTQAMSSVAG